MDNASRDKQQQVKLISTGINKKST